MVVCVWCIDASCAAFRPRLVAMAQSRHISCSQFSKMFLNTWHAEHIPLLPACRPALLAVKSDRL